MLRHPRREKHRHYQRNGSSPIGWRWGWLVVLALAIASASTLYAQGNRAQRAIEKLEGCSSRELKEGCIKILKKTHSEDSKQDIKAQLRGGRIIWYEYDADSGKARRTN
jgi:hypothetical protein